MSEIEHVTFTLVVDGIKETFTLEEAVKTAEGNCPMRLGPMEIGNLRSHLESSETGLRIFWDEIQKLRVL